jgi:hypothetical protein
MIFGNVLWMSGVVQAVYWFQKPIFPELVSFLDKSSE